MSDDNSITLGCMTCGLVFYIELLVEDAHGYPNPTYCPFCGSTDDDLTDNILLSDSPAQETTGRPALTLVQGGQSGGQDGKE